MKKYFFPTLSKKELFDLGFIATKSSHTRGSTVGLTLFDISTHKDIGVGGILRLLTNPIQTHISIFQLILH